MAKKKQAPPPPPPRDDGPPVEEGLPMWMATFADMVTLLLCFFVLLLSFAQQDVSKFKTLMGSIKDAFGIQVKRPEADFAAFSPSRYERKDVDLKKEDKQILGLVLKIKAMVEEDTELKKSTKIVTDDNGVIMRIANDVLFLPSSAALQPEAEKALAKVMAVLKEYNFNLVVRGHSDDRPLDSKVYPSHWELTSARAAAALRYIMEKGGISSTRLKAVGYANSQPLVPNNSDPNRALNRRMEFYFHRPSVKTW